MRTFIGVKLLSSKLAQPTVKPFEIYDNRLSGTPYPSAPLSRPMSVPRMMQRNPMCDVLVSMG